MSKLNPDQISFIRDQVALRRERRGYVNYREMAERFGVSVATISNAATGATYSRLEPRRGPVAAPNRWPYAEHRTLAEINRAVQAVEPDAPCYRCGKRGFCLHRPSSILERGAA